VQSYYVRHPPNGVINALMLSPIVRHLAYFSAFNASLSSHNKISELRRRSVYTRPRRHRIFKSTLAVSVFLASAFASFGDVLINLDATGLPAGPLPTWTNSGSLSGDFTSAGTVVPQVTTVAGGTGVAFLGGTTGANGTHYVGPVTPASVTGGNSRSLEAWVYNPSAQAEETVFGWGRRGGPDGSNVSFNHGTDGTFGAVGHWGAPDIGWNGQIQFSRWTYIVYTWDSTTQTTSVYKDGQLANSESGIVLNTHTTDTAGGALRFRVARQSAGGGGPSGTGVGEITIARVRVHDVVLDAATVAATFDTERAVFGLADDDNDGLPNGYELQHPGCLSPTNPADAAADCDNDGLTNLDEFLRGTIPTNADSDSDGATDGAEVNRMDGGVAAPTNPLRADTDGDNLLDGVETDTGTFVSRTNTGTDPLVMDTDADGYLDGHEVVRDSLPTDVNSVPNLVNPSPLIYLDATALPAGALPMWTNAGALGGVFNSGPAVPSVTTLQDTKGVTFDGTAHFFAGPGAPTFITGTNARTVEAWVYNPAIADEETIFSWGRRGGPDASNMSFNHGGNATFGAVGHWGAPDVGWGANPPIPGRWTFVAYSYNPVTGIGTVYRDGAVANTDTVGTLNTHGTDNTPAANRLPFRVASQNEPDGNPTVGLRGSMTIARIRVYEVALDDITITNHFTADADTFGLADNDADGMPNGYERRFPTFLDPNNPADAAMDQDSDGATNLEEFRAGTGPTVADSDGDTLSDGAELHRLDGSEPAQTDPLRVDTDQDGLADNVETDTGIFVSATDTGSDPRLADTDIDTFADGQEVFHASDPNSAAGTPDFDFTAPVAMVNLDATSLPVGALPMWTNSGAIGGVFIPDAVSVPRVEVVDGVRGVTFDGTNDIYTGPVAPVFLNTNNNRTVEAWIYNPVVAPEENLFSWGRRGGPDGSNMSFNHGTDPVFGAAGHWGAGPDIGWNGNISTGRWTFVAYTYDKTTLAVSVYRDGQLANSESGITLGTHSVDNTPGTNSLRFRVATQNDPNGTATVGLRGSMTIARIRVYDEALPATGADSIEAHFQAEASEFIRSGLTIAITYDRGAGAATITWPAAPGARYTVQASSDLIAWGDRGTGITSGSFTDDQAGAGTRRFYRVITE
jgi:hypothetical protein